METGGGGGYIGAGVLLCSCDSGAIISSDYKTIHYWVYFRETREGWCALLIVETEANGDSKSSNERGPSMVGSLGSSCLYKRFCPALAALVGPVENIFFGTLHYFNSFVPIAQHAGQAVVQSRLSLNVCLWCTLTSHQWKWEEQRRSLLFSSLILFVPQPYRDGQTDRQTERQTDGQMESETASDQRGTV